MTHVQSSGLERRPVRIEHESSTGSETIFEVIELSHAISGERFPHV